MIFDVYALPRPDSLNKLLRPSKLFERAKLKEWWTRLSEEEQTQICTIDTPKIITDVLDTANAALILFKLSSKFKEKALMSVHRVKEHDGTISSYMYDFNFAGKEIIKDDLAQLFSCYRLFGDVSSLKKKSGSQNTVNNSSTKVYMRVKKEWLSSIFDLMEKTISNFAQGKKAPFAGEHAESFYPLLLRNVFLKMPFSDVESSSIQELFGRLIILTLLLENNFYLSYNQKVTNSILSRLVNTSPVFYSQNFTPAKQEPEYVKAFKTNSPALSAVSTTETCDSNSKQQPIRKVKPFLPGPETLSHIFSESTQHNEKETSSESLGSMQGSSPRLAIENNRMTSDDLNSIGIYPVFESFANAYDGFLIGSLEIRFSPKERYYEEFSSEDEQNDQNEEMYYNVDYYDDIFEEEQESRYRSKRYSRNIRGSKDVEYQEDVKEGSQETSSEPFSTNDKRFNKARKGLRYGKCYKKKENNWEDSKSSWKRNERGGGHTTSHQQDEYADDWQGDSENGWGEYYEEPEYREPKGKWKGKVRNEVVYCVKSEK